MTRYVYLNGAFVPGQDAKISIFDRGLLFADSVYEGLGFMEGQIIDFANHMARLRRSMGEIGMVMPLTEDEIFALLMELVARSGLDRGFLYLQVTRGEAERDYIYPEGLKPNVFAFAQRSDMPYKEGEPLPIRLKSTADQRWSRRDIKTNNLLAQVLAKMVAHRSEADDALMVEPDGHVSEAGSSSFFIVRDRTLFVRPLSNAILHGVTRKTMLEVAGRSGLQLSERRYRIEDVYRADEAFITAATIYLHPVGWVDDIPIGKAEMGPVTKALRAAYLDAVRAGFRKSDKTPA
jgi:D-alanine transaminase